MSSDIFRQYEKDIRLAILIRLTEERLLNLFEEGKLFGTIHTCIGQEFVGVAVSRYIQPQDTIFSNHRCHGHFLSYNQNLTGLIGEIMGKSIGVCGGRGGSQHLHQNGFYSNGIQGGIVPIATGSAYAHKLNRDGGIAVVFIGDGTLGQGILYESMNIASKWKLPILFVCENNLYAQSTYIKQTLAGKILDRAKAFEISTMKSTTEEWIEMFKEMKHSINTVRNSQEPLFHLIDTYRLKAHSKGDDNRNIDEINSYIERDPLNKLFHTQGIPIKQISKEVNTKVELAVKKVQEAPFAKVDYAVSKRNFNTEWITCHFPKERVVDSIRRGLEEGLSEMNNLILIGEDIESPYGGAFKCTLGLSERFQNSVINTPISEAAIVGIGTGLALSGWIPVVEIMFGDFLSLTLDQWLNHAAKFRWMYNNQVSVPLIIRTPMGGKRGYGPTHSQSIEKHFIGVSDTQVLCLHHRYSPAQLYRNLFKVIDRPTIVIENKVLYAYHASSKIHSGYRLLINNENFPTVRLQPEIPADITVVAIGGISIDAEHALHRLFEEEEIIIDLFLPTCLYPFNVNVLHESLRQTRKLLVVEEGQGFVSISSEILAQVAEQFYSLQCRLSRLTATPNAIPSARPLEEQCLPNSTDIFNKILEMHK